MTSLHSRLPCYSEHPTVKGTFRSEVEVRIRGTISDLARCFNCKKTNEPFLPRPSFRGVLRALVLRSDISPSFDELTTWYARRHTRGTPRTRQQTLLYASIGRRCVKEEAKGADDDATVGGERRIARPYYAIRGQRRRPSHRRRLPQHTYLSYHNRTSLTIPVGSHRTQPSMAELESPYLESPMEQEDVMYAQCYQWSGTTF